MPTVNSPEFESQYRTLLAELRKGAGTTIVFAAQEALAGAFDDSELYEVQMLFREIERSERTIFIGISKKLDGKHSFLIPYHFFRDGSKEPFSKTATVREDGRQFFNIGAIEPTDSVDFDSALETILQKVAKPLQVLCCGNPPAPLQAWLDRTRLPQTILEVTSTIPIVRLSKDQVPGWIETTTVTHNNAPVVFFADGYILRLPECIPNAYKISVVNPVPLPSDAGRVYVEQMKKTEEILELYGPGTVVKWSRDGRVITIGDESYIPSTRFTLDLIDRIFGLKPPILICWGTPRGEVRSWLEKRQGTTKIVEECC